MERFISRPKMKMNVRLVQPRLALYIYVQVGHCTTTHSMVWKNAALSFFFSWKWSLFHFIWASGLIEMHTSSSSFSVFIFILRLPLLWKRIVARLPFNLYETKENVLTKCIPHCCSNLQSPSGGPAIYKRVPRRVEVDFSELPKNSATPQN